MGDIFYGNASRGAKIWQEYCDIGDEATVEPADSQMILAVAVANSAVSMRGAALRARQLVAER